MSLNIEDWKDFDIGDLFKVSRGDRIVKDVDYFTSKDNYYKYPVITATTKNNGVDGFYFKSNCSGNTIVCGGEASGMFSTYQPKDCWVMDRARIFTPKQDVLVNMPIGLFFVSLFNQNQYKFSYGRSANPDNIEKQTIKLPIYRNIENNPIVDETKKYSKDGYIPDFEWMEDYIKSLNSKPLTTSRGGCDNKLQLDTTKWKKFNIAKLFNGYERGIRITTLDRLTGKYPFVTAGEQDEGVSEKISNVEAITYNNAITIDMFGNCFYHEYAFKADDNILILKNDIFLNEYIGCFIATIINQDKYKNSYGRQYRQKNCDIHFIKLPICYDEYEKTPVIDLTYKYSNEGYLPNFKWMEDYIKFLPYSDRLIINH